MALPALEDPTQRDWESTQTLTTNRTEGNVLFITKLKNKKKRKEKKKEKKKHGRAEDQIVSGTVWNGAPSFFFFFFSLSLFFPLLFVVCLCVAGGGGGEYAGRNFKTINRVKTAQDLCKGHPNMMSL